jgi:hypothetical protein
MTFKVELFPNEPIVVATFGEPFDPKRDTVGASDELSKILAKTEGPLYYVPDLSAIKISFADLTIGLAEAFRKPDSAYHNPRLRTFTVGSDELVQVGVQAAAQQAQYGRAAVQYFTLLDAALTQVRAEIAKGE